MLVFIVTAVQLDSLVRLLYASFLILNYLYCSISEIDYLYTVDADQIYSVIWIFNSWIPSGLLHFVAQKSQGIHVVDKRIFQGDWSLDITSFEASEKRNSNSF